MAYSRDNCDIITYVNFRVFVFREGSGIMVRGLERRAFILLLPFVHVYSYHVCHWAWHFPFTCFLLLHSGVNDTCNGNDDNVYARCKRRNGCMLPVELKWHARMNRSNDKWIKCKKIESLCQGFLHKKIVLGDF